MNLKWISLLCFLVRNAFAFSINYAIGNTARLQMKMYKSFDLIQEDTYKRLMKSFHDEIHYEEIHGNPPKTRMKIIEFYEKESKGKCAFIGLEDETNKSTFTPYFAFIVSTPNIIPQVFHENPLNMNLEYLKHSPSYIDYLFNI